MAAKPQNIKIVEGNSFALLLTLKSRTYTADGRANDQDIDLSRLTNICVKIGGVEYIFSKEDAGLQIVVPGTLAKGTYDVTMTGMYDGAQVRAAYFEAITIVAWNNQADAEQYIAGSPVVLHAAFVIGGAFTDAELETLKTEYRRRIAAAEAAEQAAEDAKEAFDTAAENLGNLPQTLVQQEQTISRQQTTIGNQQTLIGELSGGVVMMTQSEYAPALADLVSHFN